MYKCQRWGQGQRAKKTQPPSIGPTWSVPYSQCLSGRCVGNLVIAILTFINTTLPFYASAVHPMGRRGVLFSTCPSVRACVWRHYLTGLASTFRSLCINTVQLNFFVSVLLMLLRLEGRCNHVHCPARVFSRTVTTSHAQVSMFAATWK